MTGAMEEIIKHYNKTGLCQEQWKKEESIIIRVAEAGQVYTPVEEHDADPHRWRGDGAWMRLRIYE